MKLFRPFDSIMYDTEAHWSETDPIIPYGTIAVSIDTKNTKTGDGVTKWSNITYTSGSIGGKSTSTISPRNNEIPYFDSNSDIWKFRLQGILDTSTNWSSNDTIYPTFTLLIETDTTTNKYLTGRFKISNGIHKANVLPWQGSIADLSSFPTGYSLEYNGTYFTSARYQPYNTVPFLSVPTGKFARDDGTWAFPSISSSTINLLQANSAYVFGTFCIGGFPTESTSVTLTTDGTYLFVDGSKLFTQNTGVHGSGSVSDMLDGYHATYFASAGSVTSCVVYYGSLTSAPTSYKAGDEYYNSTDSKFYKHNGTSWIAIN